MMSAVYKLSCFPVKKTDGIAVCHEANTEEIDLKKDKPFSFELS